MTDGTYYFMFKTGTNFEIDEPINNHNLTIRWIRDPNCYYHEDVRQHTNKLIQHLQNTNVKLNIKK